MKLLQTLILAIVTAACAMPSAAVEITRYVSATGSGNGQSPESPAPDLYGVLKLSRQVDALTVYVTPGIYELPNDDPDLSGAYKNVNLFGVNNFTEMLNPSPEMRPVIHCLNSGFEYSALVNLSFSVGSVGLTNCRVINVDISKNLHMLMFAGQSSVFRNVTCRNMTVFNAHGDAFLDIDNCTVSGGTVGLQVENVKVYAHDCTFSKNSAGGAEIKSLGSTFYNCDFLNNSGRGGATVWALSNDETTNFINCRFENNTTDSRDYAAGLTVKGCPVFVRKCLFLDNHGWGKLIDSNVGAFMDLDARFCIVNSSFLNNAGGVITKAYPTDRAMYDYQCFNTVFWNNQGLEVSAPNGFDVRMANCAMTGGTGIPELDAERGILALSSDMDGSDPSQNYPAFSWNEETGRYELGPNSALINAGCPTQYVTDIYGMARCLYGKTDIGAIEYVGKINIDPAQTPMNINDDTNGWVGTTEFDGTKYGFVFAAGKSLSPDKIDPEKTVMRYAIDTGKLSDTPVQKGEVLVTFIEDSGQKVYFVNKWNSKIFEWIVIDRVEYTGAKPVVKAVTGKPGVITVTANGKTRTFDTTQQ